MKLAIPPSSYHFLVLFFIFFVFIQSILFYYSHNTFQLSEELNKIFSKEQILNTTVINSTTLQFNIRNTKILERNSSEGNVLIHLIVNDEDSWGEGRSIESTLKLIKEFQYDKRRITIGILASKESQYQLIKQVFKQEIENFQELIVIFRNDLDIGIDRKNRHAPSVQRVRRRMLARYRNFLLYSLLREWHDYVLWIDADVCEISPNILKKMVECKFY